jgi:mRNA interferase YafQ
MRKIEPTTAFRKDFKRVKSTPKYRDIEPLLEAIIRLLVEDEPLPQKNYDHALSNNWKDHRECHVKPNLLLIYRKSEETLQLVRLGSHSELFNS